MENYKYGARELMIKEVNYLGKLNVVIGDELDDRFRLAIFKAKGMKKGNLTEAVEEAIELWIKSQTKEKKQILKAKAV